MSYCRDVDLVLDNGRDIDNFFDVSLSDDDKKEVKDRARERAFNYINDRYLRGKTVVPARHIPNLKEVERDLVIGNFFSAAFSQEGPNRSDWSQFYLDRAEDALKNLRFGASAEDVFADPENTGNGTVGNIEVNDLLTRTETWILRASNDSKFDVYGSLSGYLRELTVGERYPEKDWTWALGDYGFDRYRTDMRWEEFPISLTITAGSIAFVQDDKFTFKTYAASYYRQDSDRIKRA